MKIFVILGTSLVLSLFGIQNISYLKDKFLLKKEVQNIFSDLTFLNLNRQESTCLNINENSLNIFDKKSNVSLRKRVLNKKIFIQLSPKKICCYEELSCTPSSILLSFKNITCKLTISIRGQIKKICNEELL